MFKQLFINVVLLFNHLIGINFEKIRNVFKVLIILETYIVYVYDMNIVLIWKKNSNNKFFIKGKVHNTYQLLILKHLMNVKV
jgi:hypothetical protein